MSCIRGGFFVKILVDLTEAEYTMLKAYAAARRKYEVGKGYRVENAIAQAISIGIDAISETTILDKDGKLVEWKNRCDTNSGENTERIIRRKY